MMQSQTKIPGSTIAYMGLFAALAILFGYIEMLIPIHFGIPGIKLGLSNVVTVFVLYCFGRKNAFFVMLVRVFAVGFLFGNLYGIIYSLAGGILSLTVMCLLIKVKSLSMIGVSICGGIMHNLGQLLVAVFVVQELKLSAYAPILILAGTLTGFLIGVIAKLVYKRVAMIAPVKYNK